MYIYFNKTCNYYDLSIITYICDRFLFILLIEDKWQLNTTIHIPTANHNTIYIVEAFVYENVIAFVLCVSVCMYVYIRLYLAERNID